jgi:hypothetical protein
MRRGVPTESKAIAHVRQRGVLLVFPINNRLEPPSLWSEFFPKTPMVWDWNEDGDMRVGEMWQLMKRLSQTGNVVYSKWYQGRATFFSRELFTAMLAFQRRRSDPRRGLSGGAKTALEVLENNSPLSTRELKKATDLQGREHETEYNRAMKELFSRLLIVGFGEFEDGAFPSLAVGATELLFSDLWTRAEDMRLSEAESVIECFMPQGSHFRRYFRRHSGGAGRDETAIVTTPDY